MADRTTALKLTEYRAFGGNFFDSVSHASFFRTDAPHNFGVMTSRLFSSQDNLGVTNKRWTYLTMAMNNFVTLPAGTNTYRWGVVGDASVDVRITKKFVASGEQVGKGKATWIVGVDRDWFREPVLFKTEDDNAPLVRIIGEPKPDANFGYILELEIQDGNENTFMDDSLFDVGKTLVRYSTMVSNEQNTKYGQDSYANMSELQSQVGNYANKVEFTDRFLKMEMACAKKGTRNTMTYAMDGKQYNEAFSRGHMYYLDAKDKSKNKMIKKGVFVSIAEQRLLERTELDMNNMMEHGRWETTIDRDSKREMRQAPGWRQLVRDGQYFTHNGAFTLQWLVDKMHKVLYRRRNFKNRKPMLVSGTGGINFISELIAQNAPLPVVQEPGFAVRKTSNPTGVHDHEYSYGFQFTEFMGPMGIKIQVMYDPSKDDGTVYRQQAPGSYLPLESFQIDILDFGDTEDALETANNKSNITCVKEDQADYYFSVANAIQKGGIVTSGENVYNFGKELSIYREASGGLAIWDVDTVGRIEWVVK